MVLILKGGSGYCGIGRMEVVWKVMALIINRRLSTTIFLHDMLHGFWVGRGMGTASLKAKLLQQLTAMREEVFYNIYLYMYKSYAFLDRDRCLEILDGYIVGPRSCRLICTYWYMLKIMANAGGNYVEKFKGFLA